MPPTPRVQNLHAVPPRGAAHRLPATRWRGHRGRPTRPRRAGKKLALATAVILVLAAAWTKACTPVPHGRWPNVVHRRHVGGITVDLSHWWVNLTADYYLSHFLGPQADPTNAAPAPPPAATTPPLP